MAQRRRSRSRSRWNTIGIAMPDGIRSRKSTAWCDRRRLFFRQKFDRLIGHIPRLFHRHEMAGVGYVDDLRGFQLIRDLSRKGRTERVGARDEHYQQRYFAIENSLESVEVGGGLIQLCFNFGIAL